MKNKQIRHSNYNRNTLNKSRNSDEIGNSTIKTLEDLPNCIEKINQKIQSIEKSISKKELNTNRVKTFMQNHIKDNSKINSERDGNKMVSPTQKTKLNTDAYELQSLVKASVNNINDVLKFESNDKVLNGKYTTVKRTKVKRKVNENVKCKNKKSKQMKLDISSDNLNSIYINNKRCVVNTLSERNQMLIKQNVLVHKTSTHNENIRKSTKKYNNIYNTESIKTNPNELNSDDLNKFLNTNEPNPSSLNINKIDEPSKINHSSISPKVHKQFQFKPKVKKKETEIPECTNNTDRGIVSIISPKNNNTKNIITNNNNSNIKKLNKSFIEPTNSISNLNNDMIVINTQPSPKKITSFKETTAYNIQKTSNKIPSNGVNIINKKSPVSNNTNNIKNKINAFKFPSKSQHIQKSSLYSKDNINHKNLLHLMLFFNEYILSKLPSNTPQHTKTAFNSYSTTLSKLIQINKSNEQISNSNTNDKVGKIMHIQRKWREFKAKQFAVHSGVSLHNELKKMLLNNFIEKEGFGIRKVIGLLNTSVDLFSQIKDKEILISDLINITNKTLSHADKYCIYKQYINSKAGMYNNDNGVAM